MRSQSNTPLTQGEFACVYEALSSKSIASQNRAHIATLALLCAAKSSSTDQFDECIGHLRLAAHCATHEDITLSDRVSLKLALLNAALKHGIGVMENHRRTPNPCRLSFAAKIDGLVDEFSNFPLNLDQKRQHNILKRMILAATEGTNSAVKNGSSSSSYPRSSQTMGSRRSRGRR